MTGRLRLIVKSSKNSIKVLKHIYNNVASLKACGYRFAMTRIKDDSINDDLIRQLARMGITSLPALVMSDEKVIMGVDNVIRKINMLLKNCSGGKGGSVSAAGSSYDDYLMKEMYRGVKRDGRKMSVDDDDSDEEIGDGGSSKNRKERIESKMRDFETRSRRPNPRSRDRDGGGEALAGVRTEQRKQARVQPIEVDNVGNDDPDDGFTGDDEDVLVANKYGAGESMPTMRAEEQSVKAMGSTGSHLDDLMMHAWVNNIGDS